MSVAAESSDRPSTESHGSQGPLGSRGSRRSSGAASYLRTHRGIIAADATAIAVFALLARIAHNTPDMPLSVLGWLDTTWPFLLGVGVGWGALAGGLGGRAHRGPGRPLWREGITVWISTVVIGLALWGLRHGSVPHWSFVMVATIVSGALLLGWRVVASKSGRI